MYSQNDAVKKKKSVVLYFISLSVFALLNCLHVLVTLPSILCQALSSHKCLILCPSNKICVRKIQYVIQSWQKTKFIACFGFVVHRWCIFSFSWYFYVRHVQKCMQTKIHFGYLCEIVTKEQSGLLCQLTTLKAV